MGLPGPTAQLTPMNPEVQHLAPSPLREMAAPRKKMEASRVCPAVWLHRRTWPEKNAT